MVDRLVHAGLAANGAFITGIAFWELKQFTFGVYKFPHNVWAAAAFVLSIWFTMRMVEYARGYRL